MKVEADYKGKGKYYKGKITRVRQDGTFDIKYDDGDVEFGKRESEIRSLEDDRRDRDRDSPRRGKLEEGMKVEADYKGKGKYYKGKITRVRQDGTFDIKYDDGDVEFGKRESEIRSLEDDRRDRDRDSPRRGKLEEGMKVEADYKGKGKYYKGKISRDNRDGTFDIKYDDGDEEFGKRESQIRSLEGSSRSGSGGSRLEEGMKVEANYKGKGRYYKGKIARDNRDGTFDITYDDGDKEYAKREADIRSLEDARPTSPSRGGGSRLEEGMKVEANYKGKGRYYKGKIARDNRDGTFDITYDDGDKEYAKREADIRSLEDARPTSPSRGGGSRLEEGAKVEANYRGRARDATLSACARTAPSTSTTTMASESWVSTALDPL